MLLVGSLLERGELVRVLPKLIQADSRVAVVYQEKELLPPQVRAFIDVLVAWAPSAIDAVRVGERFPPRPQAQVRKQARARRPD